MVNNDQWAQRLDDNANLKQAVARACLERGLLNRFDSIFIDCGSTFVYLAEAIFEAAEEIGPITILTSNVEILHRYRTAPHADLVDLCLVGGRYIPHHQSFDGSSWNCGPPNSIDRAFIGVCPLDARLRIMASVTDVVDVKRQILTCAREAIVLCDESKLTEPPPGSRVVGQLCAQEDGCLLLQPEAAAAKPLPARLIVGVSRNGIPGTSNSELQRCGPQLVGSDRLILAQG